MSVLTEAMIVNAVVLFAVLEADLGSHRKIGVFRIVRPLLIAAGVVALFIEAPATRGGGLALEVIATVVGVAFGVLATSRMTVYLSPRTGRPVSRAYLSYALVWIVVIGARAAFSYGSQHWFASSLDTWSVQHDVTGAAITDALIAMAVAMVLTRTVAMAVRARGVHAARLTARVA